MTTISTFKAGFDQDLLRCISARVKAAEALAQQEQVTAWLEYLSVLLLGGGKRVRPFVLTLMYETVGGQEAALAREAALSLELFHLFALVHDDIMDRSNLRHGLATVHAHIEQALEGHPEAAQAALSQAIVIGDLLQNWAGELMPAALRPQYHEMVTEVIIGQMLDINLTCNYQATQEEIFQKHELKTARYTFVRPMQMGASLAGGSPQSLRFCEEFGTALGLAFQIQDDLLDISKSTHSARKAVLRDMQCGQPTLFTTYVREHGSPSQRQQLERYFGKPLEGHDHQALVDLFRDSGAISYGEGLIADYCQAAEQAVEGQPMDVAYRTSWLELVQFIRHRRF